MTDGERHTITRIRRERRRRSLTVGSTERLGPSMLRLTFHSPDLVDFESAAPDDHVKLFVPDGAGGMAMRDYTPRSFDAAARSLVIDFALHDAGPATAWALAARPGDKVQIGGPQGSSVVADDFDWYLLIGDETALPAIGRRLDELRPGVPVSVVALVDAADDRIALSTRPCADIRWCLRADGGDIVYRLLAIVDDLPSRAGDGYVWIAAEADLARRVRGHVVDRRGHPRQWVKAAGYWTAGVADAHERIED